MDECLNLSINQFANQDVKNKFFNWGYDRWIKKLKEKEKIQIRTTELIDISGDT